MEIKTKDRFTGLNFDKIFRRLLLILPLGVIVNVVISYLTIDQNIWDEFDNFSPGFLLIAAMLSLVPWFTHSLRIFIWTRFLDKKISFFRLYKIAIGSELGAAISPGVVGGAPVKTGMLMQNGLSPAASLFLTIMGSVEDWIFFSLAIPTALTLTTSWSHPLIQEISQTVSQSNLPKYLLIFVLALLLFLQINRHCRDKISQTFNSFKWTKKIKNKIQQIFKDMVLVYKMIARDGKALFVLSVSLTIFQWMCRYTIMYVLLLSLGIRTNPIELFLMQALVFMIMIFIPTPGATVGAEATFFYVFRTFLPSPILGLVTTGWRFLTYYFQLTLGTLVFLLSSLKNNSPEDPFDNESFEPAEVPAHVQLESHSPFNHFAVLPHQSPRL